MGLFGTSKKETCFLCGKEVNTSLLNSNCIPLADRKYICNACAKEYGVVRIEGLFKPDITSEMVERRVCSKNLVTQKKFIPTQIIKRAKVGDYVDIPIMEVDENAGLINLLIPAFKHSSVDYIKPVDKMLNFELLEDDKSIVDGNSLLGAVAGGELFGAAGAIVGAGLNSKDVIQTCRSMKIRLIFDDMEEPNIYLDIFGRQISGSINKAGSDYKAFKNVAYECMALLSVLLEHNKANKAASAAAATAEQAANTQGSVADEILKFKQLLDMGAITQEEFDAKKKELLGL